MISKVRLSVMKAIHFFLHIDVQHEEYQRLQNAPLSSFIANAGILHNIHSKAVWQLINPDLLHGEYQKKEEDKNQTLNFSSPESPPASATSRKQTRQVDPTSGKVSFQTAVVISNSYSKAKVFFRSSRCLTTLVLIATWKQVSDHTDCIFMYLF